MAIEDLPIVARSTLKEQIQDVNSNEDYIKLLGQIDSRIRLANPVLAEFIVKVSSDSDDAARVLRAGYFVFDAIERHCRLPIVSKGVYESSFLKHISKKQYEIDLKMTDGLIRKYNPVIWYFLRNIAGESSDPEMVKKAGYGVCQLIGLQIDANYMNEIFDLER